jgi:hypothetical protein
MAESTPELKTYYGNCHCGAFKFNVQIPELTSFVECNCSICMKKGYRLIFPGKGFTIEQGDELLVSYTYGNCALAHKVNPSSVDSGIEPQLTENSFVQLVALESMQSDFQHQMVKTSELM